MSAGLTPEFRIAAGTLASTAVPPFLGRLFAPERMRRLTGVRGGAGAAQFAGGVDDNCARAGSSNVDAQIKAHDRCPAQVANEFVQ